MDVPNPADLATVGLGLDHDELRLARTTAAWLAAGAGLRDRVAQLLAGHSVPDDYPALAGHPSLVGRQVEVEVIGSSAVPGLLAKPIVDLAVGVAAASDGGIRADGNPPADLLALLVADGWSYRGDAGNDGGHVFVLETRPWHRVAHLHLVELGGEQWCNYLRLRDLLRRSPVARARYQEVKLRLAGQQPVDRTAYTSGKTDVVAALLADRIDRIASPAAQTESADCND